MAIALDRSKQHLDFIIAQAEATNGYMNQKDVTSTVILRLGLIRVRLIVSIQFAC